MSGTLAPLAAERWRPVYSLYVRSAARVVTWSLAIVVALSAARYFLVPPPWVPPPLPPAIAALFQGQAGDAVVNLAPNLYARYRGWLLCHIAGGIVTMILGLFQFLASIRDARPAVHRALGTVYVLAVLAGSVAGLRLAIGTPGLVAAEVRSQFVPVSVSFAALSITWPTITLIAFQRARARRFDDHRAWMIRSYSLTFAAVTVRLVAPLFLMLIPDPVMSGSAAIFTWPVNLLVAEWLIRRKSRSVMLPVVARHSSA